MPQKRDMVLKQPQNQREDVCKVGIFKKNDSSLIQEKKIEVNGKTMMESVVSWSRTRILQQKV